MEISQKLFGFVKPCIIISMPCTVVLFKLSQISKHHTTVLIFLGLFHCLNLVLFRFWLLFDVYCIFDVSLSLTLLVYISIQVFIYKYRFDCFMYTVNLTSLNLTLPAYIHIQVFIYKYRSQQNLNQIKHLEWYICTNFRLLYILINSYHFIDST